MPTLEMLFRVQAERDALTDALRAVLEDADPAGHTTDASYSEWFRPLRLGEHLAGTCDGLDACPYCRAWDLVGRLDAERIKA